MSPTPTIEDLEKDEAAKAQAVIDAQAAHTEAVGQLQAAKEAATQVAVASEAASAPGAGSVPVNEVVPAPAAASTSPELVPFGSTMDLITTADPTQTFDPATGADVGSIPVNTKFKAIGKYEGGPSTYYSDGNLSVRTVDLQPDQDPSAATPDSEDVGEKVEVKVLPSDPNAWKREYQDFIGGPAMYQSTVGLTIHDKAGLLPDVAVTEGKGGTFVGKFKAPDGTWNYLSKRSRDEQDPEGNGPWYGYPIESFQRVDAIENGDQLEDLFDPEEAKQSEVKAGYGKAQKAVAAAGMSAGLINRLRGKRS